MIYAYDRELCRCDIELLASPRIPAESEPLKSLDVMARWRVKFDALLDLRTSALGRACLSSTLLSAIQPRGWREEIKPYPRGVARWGRQSRKAVVGNRALFSAAELRKLRQQCLDRLHGMNRTWNHRHKLRSNREPSASIGLTVMGERVACIPEWFDVTAPDDVSGPSNGKSDTKAIDSSSNRPPMLQRAIEGGRKAGGRCNDLRDSTTVERSGQLILSSSSMRAVAVHQGGNRG